MEIKKKYMLLGALVVISIMIILALYVKAGTITGTEEVITKDYSQTMSPALSEYLATDFNTKYGAITLINSTTTFKMAEYTLTKNTDYCLKSCEAEGKAVLYQEGKLFDSMLFKALSGKVTSIKTLEYQLLDGYKEATIKVPDKVQQVCEIYPANKTDKEQNLCHEEILTYKDAIVQMEIWSNYKGDILKAGNYTWKIKGTKDAFQSVDFIPVKYNKEFTEWATWNSSFSNGLLAYYNMNSNTSNIIIDSTNNKNGTIFDGSTTLETGLISNGYQTTNPAGRSGWNTTLVPTGTQLSVAFWIYGDFSLYYEGPRIADQCNVGGGCATNGCFRTYPDGGVDHILTLNWYDSSSKTAKTTAGAVKNSQWNLIVETLNATHGSIYVNGNLNQSTATDGSFSLNSNKAFKIRERVEGQCGQNGNVFKMDEVGLWNRTLTTSEITDLWNGGLGMTYSNAAVLSIVGKVVDTNGANIASAKVILLDTNGNLIASTTSNASGDWSYSFTNQTITNYTIVGYNPNNVSQGGNAYPFFNA